MVNEVAVYGEYYIIPESDRNYFYSIMQVRGGLSHFNQPFSLYVTAGIGGIHYIVTPLEALATSSRFNGDNSLALVIPAGIGVKFAILPRTTLGAELIGRYTTSNTLDGFASEYGKYNDVYHTLIIKVNYKIHKQRKQSFGPPRKRRFWIF
jgi:opacity protein-like surface antigen